jgi:hypothetical protein
MAYAVCHILGLWNWKVFEKAIGEAGAGILLIFIHC